jgi:hypothetical protein
MEKSLKCSNCQHELGENDIFCPDCGFPENGTQEDRNKYNYSIKLKKDVIQDGKKKLKNVKILLFVIAGINFLFGIYYLTNEFTYIDGITNLIAAAIFLGCVIWVNNQPLTGIIAAFIFWILIQLSVVLIDPFLLIKGFLLKIIFIGIFLKGISSARDAKKYTDQLKEMKVR